ncbi:hypothetical protein ACTFIW_010318 [Dictyostelium discoideum]
MIFAPVKPSFWQNLALIKKCRFTRKSHPQGQNSWSGDGQGDFEVTKKENEILYEECGNGQNERGSQFQFHNTYQWIYSPQESTIRLSHMRFNRDAPIKLLLFSPSQNHIFTSESFHLCGSDCYSGMILCQEQEFQLHWRVASKAIDVLVPSFEGIIGRGAFIFLDPM